MFSTSRIDQYKHKISCECQICLAPFSENWSLKRHLANVHQAKGPGMEKMREKYQKDQDKGKKRRNHDNDNREKYRRDY
jgi:acetone carboxylase gamma subunit